MGKQTNGRRAGATPRGRTVAAGRPTKAKTRRPLKPAKFIPQLVAVPQLATVRTKFVVSGKTEVPVVAGGAVGVRYKVELQAAYEPRSILNGLATEQGNADNRVFGRGAPEAALAMVIESKAIADVFRPGRAFLLDLTEVVDTITVD